MEENNMNSLQLLHILENDPASRIDDLADILNESVENVKKEKNKLEEDKIICGYHTVINWDKTNEDVCEAVILVSAKPETCRGYDRVAEKIARLDEVTDLYLMSGENEFYVKVKDKTMRQIADFVGSRLAPVEGVQRTITCFILKKYKVDGINLEFEKEKDERIQIS